MPIVFSGELLEKVEAINLLDKQGYRDEAEALCQALALGHFGDESIRLKMVLHMTASGMLEYAKIYIICILEQVADRDEYIECLVRALADKDCEEIAYLYLLRALVNYPRDIGLRQKALDLSLYLGCLDESYHWAGSLAFYGKDVYAKGRQNRLALFLGKIKATADFQVGSGVVYSRSSNSSLKSKGAPGEKEILSMNPARHASMKEVTGWEHVFPGTLNLRIDFSMGDIIYRIPAVAYEPGQKIKYPPAHQAIPKKRIGYWYYRGFLFFSGKVVPVLFRYPEIPHDNLTLEVFSVHPLREKLEVTDGDQVFCYFCSTNEEITPWLECKLDIYSIFMRRRQKFGRNGEFYQGHEEWALPGQRPTIFRMEAYALRKWVTPEAHVLDIGCNIGCFGIEVSKSVATYTGLDIGSDLIDVANSLARHERVDNCTFLCCGFYDFLSGNEKTYDVVFSFAVHVWIAISMRDYIERLRQVLSPEGVVIIESNNLDKNDQDFMGNMSLFLESDFMLLHQGEITDDGVIRRAFCVFKSLY